MASPAVLVVVASPAVLVVAGVVVVTVAEVSAHKSPACVLYFKGTAFNQ
jgi:hypothetical protein